MCPVKSNETNRLYSDAAVKSYIYNDPHQYSGAAVSAALQQIDLGSFFQQHIYTVSTSCSIYTLYVVVSTPSSKPHLFCDTIIPADASLMKMC